MEKIKKISIIVFGVIAFVVFYVAYISNSQKNLTGNDVAVTPISADDFINNSAETMLNPNATANEATDAKGSIAVNPICQHKSGWLFSCYSDYYKKLVKESGAEVAIQDIKSRYSSDSYVMGECHPLMHVIGNAAASKYANLSEAYQHGDNFCWAGYYHGVLEGVVAKIGLANLKNELNDICKNIPGKATYSFDYYNCLHGLGHGIMETYDDDLFKSLAMCDNLQGDWEKSSCYSGVFMENIMIDQRGEVSDYLKPSDLLYPCDIVDYKYKETCYLMQTSYALKATHDDFQKVFNLCSKADGDFQDVCYQSLGRDASGTSISDVNATRTTCYLGKNFEQISNCIVGAVKDFISYYHGIDKANQLCNSLTSDMQNICLTTVQNYYKSF